MPSIAGKRVLITGASSGIGAAAAEAFAKEGCDVALLARSPEGLARSAARVRGCGARAVVLPCDITDRDALEAAVGRAVAELGGLDLLVSNAAATIFGDFGEVAPDDFDRVLDVTFRGAVDAIRLCLGELERSHGAIVVVGSIMCKVPLPTFSSYAAAKHALRGFVGSLRNELRAKGSPVTISMVHPGTVDTPLWETTSSATGRLPRSSPEGYRPEVLAAAVVALAERPRAEVTVGGEAKAIELAFVAARPVGDLALRFAYRLYRSGRKPSLDAGSGALAAPVGRGRKDGRRVIGRPSLWAPVRLWPRVGLRGLRDR